jgi:hypothetical protein
MGDVRAGLSVAGLLLPSAIAYAAIAGLPPAPALIATLVGLGIYAACGRSRFAMVAAHLLCRSDSSHRALKALPNPQLSDEVRKRRRCSASQRR